jgi:D-2-hydroxyacid dehydrogenase (NADP+)
MTPLKPLHLLVSPRVREAAGAALAQQARQAGRELQLHTPQALAEPAGAACLPLLEAAFVSPDVLGDSSKTQLTPEMAAFCGLLDRAPALAWVQLPSAGWDRPQFVAWKARGVTLCNASGIASVAVAQSAVAGMLALARHLPQWMQAQRRRAWEPLRGAREPAVLEDKTAVVVGLGAIGQEIARLCRALRMQVIGVSQSGVDKAGVCDEALPQAQLDQALQRCDWLLLSCPLTPQTQGLFDAGRFAQLRRGARLVDVSRGGVVRESALLGALQNGALAAAYLDVMETEPLPPDSPLWSHPAVLVSPHYAGDYQGRQEKLTRLFGDNLGRHLRGEPLINAV